MCGIVGYLGTKEDSLAVILSGLEKLEYRGYDSAGVAIYEEGKITVTRATGKLGELKKLFLTRGTKKSSLGIGHTRWATHGRPSETNAHPHSAGRVSLIHNGIIENYIELKAELQKTGSKFVSETDTEVAAHLLNAYLERGLKPYDALKKMCASVRGSYAFVAIDAHHPDRLLVAKNATPIVIGMENGEVVVASDIPAVLNITRNVTILEDGDIAEITANGITIENAGQVVSRPAQKILWDPVTAQKGGYKHFMLKEIHEQPQVVSETLRGRITDDRAHVVLGEMGLTSAWAKDIERVMIVACGTAWHAGLIAKFYIESFAKIPVEVDYASEFRYRDLKTGKNVLVMAISQSGETADTLAAIEKGLAGSPCAAICNVVGSSLARKVSKTLFTHAGPEISVASTKAFTTQLTAAYLFGVALGQARGVLPEAEASKLLADAVHLPVVLNQALGVDKEIEVIAKKFHTAKDYLFLGRGICYPVALEGALKLKEISYIHAEGYPAGEMKHGPIALIDEKMPVVVVLQKSDLLFEKTISNLREVESRGGKIIAVTDHPSHPALQGVCDSIVSLPHLSEMLSPIILTIPLQLLAYYTATLNGTDVDLPRNLAKSVTVE
jgi:glucosamine--fructose-6-phosphate aminotransferase (isomerizing)